MNIISEKRVSFYIPSYGLPIYTDFGPYNPNAIRQGEAFVSISLTGIGPFLGYWVATVDAYRFPYGSPNALYTFEPQTGVIATGQAVIQGPAKFIDAIRYRMYLSVKVTRVDPYRGQVFNCDDANNLGSFSLRFGTYWFQVDGQDLLINLGNGECSLSLEHNDANYWILGFGFLRNYYTSFDFEHKLI
jgi:hypothetical protein